VNVILHVTADSSIVNKRQSMVIDDELQVKIADLGNACWTVSHLSYWLRWRLILWYSRFVC